MGGSSYDIFLIQVQFGSIFIVCIKTKKQPLKYPPHWDGWVQKTVNFSLLLSASLNVL